MIEALKQRISHLEIAQNKPKPDLIESQVQVDLETAENLRLSKENSELKAQINYMRNAAINE